ncbi:MAG: hypothetical protein AB7U41_01610, partial [Dongiaceae bacterium]
MIRAAYSLAFDPLFSQSFLGVIAVFLLLIAALRLLASKRGRWARILVIAAFFLILLNPVLLSQQKQIKPDTVFIVRDQSPSNNLSERGDQTEAAVSRLLEQARQFPNLEIKLIESAAGNQGTRLFSNLERAMADVPPSQRSAVIIVSDGQVHDAPANFADGHLPLHLVLTGSPDEFDARLSIVEAEGYGLAGKTQKIKLRADIDGPASHSQALPLEIRSNGVLLDKQILNPGEITEISLPIAHAGANLFELALNELPGELSGINNRRIVTIHGVHDRLRVLLISGEPHLGTRIWRNFLKSDPAVDLVHFTILRPPEKQDATPTEELSLIAFPIKELFEEKLNEFNLVIFDRFRRLGVIPSEYLVNIKQYVEKGGALLEVAGPAFASPLTLFDSPLGSLLPGQPTGKISQSPFIAQPTEAGLRHPITAELSGIDAEGRAHWGPWLRLVEAKSRSGVTLLSTDQNQPVLLLDRVGQGRVAQLFSDQLWLWARGYKDGGPHGELLRRLVHWLMKEPELEEESILARADGHFITIERRSLKDEASSVSVKSPSGETARFDLEALGRGLARATIEGGENGVYEISDQSLTTLVAIGGADALEMGEIIATPKRLENLAQNTGGSIHWWKEYPNLSLRRTSASRSASGSDWIGLPRREEASSIGVEQIPLLPPW